MKSQEIKKYAKLKPSNIAANDPALGLKRSKLKRKKLSLYIKQCTRSKHVKNVRKRPTMLQTQSNNQIRWRTKLYKMYKFEAIVHYKIAVNSNSFASVYSKFAVHWNRQIQEKYQA